MKTCTKCHETKTEADFYTHKRGKNGLAGRNEMTDTEKRRQDLELNRDVLRLVPFVCASPAEQAWTLARLEQIAAELREMGDDR